MSDPCLHCIRAIFNKEAKTMAPAIMTFATEADANRFGLYT